jgi:nitrogen fixation protein FixH
MTARARQSGWWYPWIFVGGMLVVIAVNAVLCFFAVDTFPGLETKDHYRKGLAYNRALAAAEIQDRLGWRMDLSFIPHTQAGNQHGGELVVSFTDKDGNPLRNLSVAAALVRPTHEGFDTSIDLNHGGDGHYAGMVAMPLPGQWEARVRARGDGQDFRKTQRIFVP